MNTKYNAIVVGARMAGKCNNSRISQSPLSRWVGTCKRRRTGDGSWSGQGIDQASTHVTMLADALLKWYSGYSTWINAMTEYHKRRNDFSLKTYERNCMIARDLRMLTGPALTKRSLAKG